MPSKLEENNKMKVKKEEQRKSKIKGKMCISENMFTSNLTKLT